jgi:S-(hydroxymethyl)glutathione dehydrogenase / alcohol dehydrogenase
VRAAILHELKAPLSVEEVEPIGLAPRDVLVSIEASGLCHSDLLFQVGAGRFPPPMVLGHEGAGVVEEVGADVRSLRPGDRVICSWVTVCGECRLCLMGYAHLCDGLADAWAEPKLRTAAGSEVRGMLGVGTFADGAVIDERALVKVESDLPAEQLALIGCGVTTGVGAALNTAAVAPGSTVAVFGCGGVGQSVVQGARIAGAARIVAVDPVELKRSMALQMGATDVVDPTEGDPAEQIRELTGGRGADYAFDAAGLEQTMGPAYESLRRGGTLVLVGIPHPKTRIPWPPVDQILTGKRVLGCLYGSSDVRRDFPRLLELAESGKLDLASMVSRTITLDNVNDGLEAIERGEVIRSVIVN